MEVTTCGMKYQANPSATSSTSNVPVDREPASCESDAPLGDSAGDGRAGTGAALGAAAICEKKSPTDFITFPAAEGGAGAGGGG